MCKSRACPLTCKYYLSTPPFKKSSCGPVELRQDHTKSLITCFTDSHKPGRYSDPGGRGKYNSYIKYIYSNYSVMTVLDSDGIIKSCFASFSPVGTWMAAYRGKFCPHFGTINK